jgi:3-dehydroquinate dehydratase / shikimate dehydrogenase
MICVSLGRTRHKMVTAEHAALAQRGAQLVELRMDWLQRSPDLGRLVSDRPTPVIVTCRRPADGGRWSGPEEQRQLLLRSAIVAGVEYVDLEADIAKKIRRYGKTKRIISYHNFDETPDTLEETYAELCELDADIVKIVTMANSPSDNVRLLQLMVGAKVPTIAFCMGEFGLPSRLLCGKFGAPFTYATFSQDRELAPGQLSFDVMTKLYQYDRISPSTRLFGVLGDPIGHSLSPLIHNTAMRAAGFDGVYVPFRVPQDQFAETLKAFEWLNVSGYSVTIPHKQAALAIADTREEIAEQIGAANTLFRATDGSWRADNTDYQAALDALQTGFRDGETLDGKRVLMLGAGGAARALGLGIVRHGGALVISSRTADRARKLADSLGCRYVTWENRGSESIDILVNCTPVGMHPSVDESPYEMHWLREEMLVFDTIYNPEQTLLIKHARERTCRTVSGMEMFVRQAAAQFERFTGQSAPLDLMAETVRKGISAAKL